MRVMRWCLVGLLYNPCNGINAIYPMYRLLKYPNVYRNICEGLEALSTLYKTCTLMEVTLIVYHHLRHL